MKKVLVLTYGEDPHADSVCKFFDKKGVKYFRVDTEKITDNYKICFDSSKSIYTISNHKKR